MSSSTSNLSFSDLYKMHSRIRDANDYKRSQPINIFCAVQENPAIIVHNAINLNETDGEPVSIYFRY